MYRFPFDLDATAGAARATTLHLRRGTVRTPVFMPVGTQGAIRALPPVMLDSTHSQIILANTYHLSQRPGEHIVEKHGGLHGFMGVDKPILTDSGGFQVFSLDKTVDEDGVTFAYEVDGKRTFLSPERSMEIQQALGSDIAMVFDECLGFGTDKASAVLSVDRTARWEAYRGPILGLHARYETLARSLRKQQDRFNRDAPGPRSERPAIWVEYHLERLERRLRDAGAPEGYRSDSVQAARVLW